LGLFKWALKKKQDGFFLGQVLLQQPWLGINVENSFFENRSKGSWCNDTVAAVWCLCFYFYGASLQYWCGGIYNNYKIDTGVHRSL